MKKVLLLAALGTLVLAACNKEDNQEPEVKNQPKVPAESISLNKEKLSLPPGEKIALQAVLTPEEAADGTIVWISGDTSVATVSEEGVVEGIALGETDIMAVAGKYLANCHVTVVKPITGITLYDEPVEIVVNKTFQLEAIIAPDDATEIPEWSSDNPEIATVDENGFVTAVAIGKANITAKAFYTEAKCEVDVLPVPVEKIEINPTVVCLYTDMTKQLTATVLPENAADKTIVWSVEDEGIVTIDANGLVTAVGTGATYIHATASNGVDAKVFAYAASPTSVPFSEDFNNTDNLTYWVTKDFDGDGHPWYTHSDGDNGCIISYSYFTGALTPDDWAITPPIKLDEKFNQLGFWVWPYSNSYPIETYGAYILTDFPSDNPVLLVQGTLTNGVSYIYENPAGSGSFHETDGSKEHIVVDIPQEYCGQIVFIGFRHFDSYDNYALILDDVLVSNVKIEPLN